MKSLQVIALTMAASCFAGFAAQAAPLKTAVFPFELDDTSLQGSMQGKNVPDEARLAQMRAQAAALLAQSGKYDPIAIPTAVLTQAKNDDLRSCDGCEVALAKKLGAQVSVIGWVQKVSDLILNINIVVRDVATGKETAAGSVDIRGDTDESWSRGLRYLVKNRILTEPAPTQ